MIDSSIYFQQKSADPFGSYAEGRKMGDMIRQQQKQKGVEQAYKAGMVQNPDGTYKQDLGVTMSALAKGGYAQEYSSLAQQQKEQQAAQAKTQREQQLQAASDVGRLAGSALQNPNAWMQIRTEAIKKGYGTEESLPQAYDEKFLRGIQSQALTVAEQMGQQNKDREFSLKERELALKAREDQAKRDTKSGGQEGRKALDKDFAKDYNDWTTGAAKRSRNEIQKLEGVVQRLNEKKGTTGGLTGLFGDRLTSDDVLKNRADVQQSAMTLIKQLLSGATSDTDRKAIVDTLWNEADSTENNISRIERFIGDMKNRADDYDAKASFFEKNNTLGGYKAFPEPSAPRDQSKPQNIAATKPSWAK